MKRALKQTISFSIDKPQYLQKGIIIVYQDEEERGRIDFYVDDVEITNSYVESVTIKGDDNDKLKKGERLIICNKQWTFQDPESLIGLAQNGITSYVIEFLDQFYSQDPSISVKVSPSTSPKVPPRVPPKVPPKIPSKIPSRVLYHSVLNIEYNDPKQNKTFPFDYWIENAGSGEKIYHFRGDNISKEDWSPYSGNFFLDATGTPPIFSVFELKDEKGNIYALLTERAFRQRGHALDDLPEEPRFYITLDGNKDNEEIIYQLIYGEILVKLTKLRETLYLSASEILSHPGNNKYRFHDYNLGVGFNYELDRKINRLLPLSEEDYEASLPYRTYDVSFYSQNDDKFTTYKFE